MPYAFGHLMGCWAFAKLYEKLRKYAFSHMEWGLLLFGSIVPDADLLIDWAFGTTIHRGVMHSLFFSIIAGIIVYGLATALKQKYKTFKPAAYGFAIALGILTHIILDMVLGRPGIRALWPSTMGFWLFGMAPYPPHTFFSNDIVRLMKFAIGDMALGTAWIGYFWLRKRIKF
ncbi:metal-dependent hydrolase [Candidatus Woesearchaeota archaeon]|nr:metal-dependent hydrolase [Candidatus Woesearchaeota archaeon]